MDLTNIFNNVTMMMIIAGFFVAFFLIAITVVNILFPQRSILKSQIRHYDFKRSKGADEDKSQEKMTMISDAVNASENFIQKRNFTQDINMRLDQAGLSLKAGEFALMQLAFAIFSGFMGLSFTGSLGISFLIIMIAAFLPFAVLEVLKSMRLKAFHEQLPETLQLIAGALRAGYSFMQALKTVVDEGEKPSSSEFSRVITETNLGGTVDDSLMHMADRVKDENFYWAVLAIKMQRDVGGNLAEILDILSTTIRERDYVKRQIKVLTSEGRLSAVILVGLPIAMAAMIAIVNPGYLNLLFTDPLGWAMVGLSVFLLIAGTAWLMKIVKIDV